MSVIPASSVKCSTLVDGTLRIVVEVEPNHALDAFTLFRSPGTPMALAALKTATAEPESVPCPERSTPLKEGPRRKLGPICEWLVYRCKEPEFQEWAFNRGAATTLEEDVADWCRNQCFVSSRSAIDGNADAEARFESLIRKPWAMHTKAAERHAVPDR